MQPATTGRELASPRGRSNSRTARVPRETHSYLAGLLRHVSITDAPEQRLQNRVEKQFPAEESQPTTQRPNRMRNGQRPTSYEAPFEQWEVGPFIPNNVSRAERL